MCRRIGYDSAMSGDSLHAPWRMEYLRSLQKDDAAACFLCQAVSAAPREHAARLVLWTTEQSIVIINKFPYTNGHLLVAPKSHIADLEALSDAQILDLQKQTAEALKLLKRALSPQGFNIGINIGRVAGAGLPGHIHQHVVPRWGGDTNFMSVIGDIRVVPQAMSQLYEELMRVRNEKNS
jgi:ATP adenylyltransferase